MSGHTHPASATEPMPLPGVLQEAIDLLNDGIAIFDEELRLVLCNANFIALRRYPERLGRPGTPIAELYRYNAARGDYGEVDVEKEVQTRVQRAASLQHHELDQELADGTILHVRYARMPCGGLLFAYDDVTENRRTEEALRESERRHALVAEATTEGFYEWHIEAHEFFASPRACEIFGFESGEVRPKEWEWNDRVHPDDFDHYRRSLAAALKDDAVRYECEYQVRKKDGDYMWIADRGFVSKRAENGRATRFLGAIRDITTRKRTEEALRASEERYALAMAGANEGLWDWNVETGKIFVSPRFRQLLDIDHDEPTLSAEQWQSRIHPDYVDHFRKTIQAHLRGETDFYSCEFRTLDRDGQPHWVHHRGAAMRDASGRVYRMAGSMGDITPLKRREEELREAKEAAERALEELTAAQRSLVQAEKMASLGELTAGIAHEIKNPLHFINNFSDTCTELLDELNGVVEGASDRPGKDTRDDVSELITALKEDLGSIREHGMRADGIVKGMLLHARGDTGERQRVDLNGLLGESLNLAYHGRRATSAGFNVTIERELDEALGEFEIVPQEITRVFLNLVGNSFYAVHERAQAAGDADYQPKVRASTRLLADDRAEIKVWDNGIGMSASALEKVFTPFFSSKPAGEGTGLGLSISHDIVVQQHGGSMRVESEEGQYTEFIVELPRNLA